MVTQERVRFLFKYITLILCSKHDFQLGSTSGNFSILRLRDENIRRLRGNTLCAEPSWNLTIAAGEFVWPDYAHSAWTSFVSVYALWSHWIVPVNAYCRRRGKEYWPSFQKGAIWFQAQWATLKARLGNLTSSLLETRLCIQVADKLLWESFTNEYWEQTPWRELQKDWKAK